jgi:hypothetical protein
MEAIAEEVDWQFSKRRNNADFIKRKDFKTGSYLEA